MNKDFAVVVGHTEDNPGACSDHDVPCEWEFNSQIAEYMKDMAHIYFYDTYMGGYTNMVKRNANKLNNHNYKLIVELHYNAAVPEANGTEALYYFNNKRTRQICSDFCTKFCNVFGTKYRGAKALVNKEDRGFASVYYPKADTILLEPFFGSNEDDCKKIIGKEREYAELIKLIMIESVYG